MNVRELKAARVRLGYRQSDVAKQLGISTSSWNAKENGRTGMTRDQIIKCCEIFKLSFDQMNDFIFDGKLPNGSYTDTDTQKAANRL